MTPEEKDRIAQEKYGKPYAELDTSQKRGVGGVYSGTMTGAPKDENDSYALADPGDEPAAGLAQTGDDKDFVVGDDVDAADVDDEVGVLGGSDVGVDSITEKEAPGDSVVA